MMRSALFSSFFITSLVHAHISPQASYESQDLLSPRHSIQSAFGQDTPSFSSFANPVNPVNTFDKDDDDILNPFASANAFEDDFDVGPFGRGFSDSPVGDFTNQKSLDNVGGGFQAQAALNQLQRQHLDDWHQTMFDQFLADRPPLPFDFQSQLQDPTPTHQPLFRMRSNRKLLVWDLDNTLISSQSRFARDTPRKVIHNSPFSFEIHVRPGLHALLKKLARYYDFAFFTASPQLYADKALAVIDPNGRWFPKERRLYQPQMKNAVQKDLNLFGVNLKKVVLVDDSTSSFEAQLLPLNEHYAVPTNGLLVNSFNGVAGKKARQTCLEENEAIFKILKQLAFKDDVRPDLVRYNYEKHSLVSTGV